MPELLRSAKLAVEKGLAQGHNETYVKQLSDYIIPALVEAIPKVIVDDEKLTFWTVYLFFQVIVIDPWYLRWLNCISLSGTRHRDLREYVGCIK